MRTIKKEYIILSALALASIITLAVMCVRFKRTYDESAVWVRHTHLVLDATQQALAGLHPQENTPFDGQLDTNIRALGRLTADNPLQHRRFDSLRGALPGNPGRSREILERMQNEEHRLLAAREDGSARSRRVLVWGTIYLLTFTFLLFCVSTGLVLFQLSRRVKVEAKLRESDRRFRLLVQREPNHAMFLLAPGGWVMSWNEGARRLLGYTEEEATGMHVSLFHIQADVDAGLPARLLRLAEEKGETTHHGWRKRKDGSSFWADVMITALREDNGTLMGFIKITRDMSDQHQAEVDTQHALEQEKETSQTKSRFVSLASHEFKTPLTVILSSLNLIEKYEAEEHIVKRRQHIHRIRSNIGNLRQILSDFLSVEQLESGGIMNNPVPTDIERLVNGVVTDMETSCKENQHISIEKEGDSRQVTVDPRLLLNVLTNLVSNAVKYSPAGSDVCVMIRFENDSLVLKVADQGIGIPQDEQDVLFERYFRGSNTSGISGTGLGLSIVKRYAELMGADIRFYSRPPEGTTFTLVIPLEAALSPVDACF